MSATKRAAWHSVILIFAALLFADALLPASLPASAKISEACREVLSDVPTLFDLLGKRIRFLPRQALFACSDDDLRAAPLHEGTVDGLRFLEWINSPDFVKPDTGRVRTLPIGCMRRWPWPKPQKPDAIPLRDALKLSSMAILVAVEDTTVGLGTSTNVETLLTISVIDVLRSQSNVEPSPGETLRFLLPDGRLELPSGVELCSELGGTWYVPSVGDRLLMVAAYPTPTEEKILEVGFLFRVESGLVYPNAYFSIEHTEPALLAELYD